MSHKFFKPPAKAKGCTWEAWSGPYSISDKLVVHDADIAIGDATDLSVRGRRALADHMIGLWSEFREGKTRVK